MIIKKSSLLYNFLTITASDWELEDSCGIVKHFVLSLFTCFLFMLAILSMITFIMPFWINLVYSGLFSKFLLHVSILFNFSILILGAGFCILCTYDTIKYSNAMELVKSKIGKYCFKVDIVD